MTLTIELPRAYEGPRTEAAAYFTHAHAARALTTLPRLVDGDTVSCPAGYLWLRRAGVWIAPGQRHGLCLMDMTVAAWWRRRDVPGSRFALVHQLSPVETRRIAAPWYTDDEHDQRVEGWHLRHIAKQLAGARTISVHLELPSGIVTMHSHFAANADVVFLPSA